MSNLSDFIASGAGGFLPYKEFLNATGTITLDLSEYSAFKVTQGAADLTINFVEDDPELRGEADLFLTKNQSFSLTVNSDEIIGISISLFDISTASYDSVSLSVSAQDSTPFGIAFNSDGSKMYVLGYDSNSVYQYTLTAVNKVSQFGAFTGITSEAYSYAV